MTTERRLRIGDLNLIKNELWDARTKWKDLGDELKMSRGSLDSIAIVQRDDPGNCFRDMLAEWLRGSGNPPRIWPTIEGALRSQAVSRGDLADKIKNKFVDGEAPPPEEEPPPRTNSVPSTPTMKYLTKWRVIPTIAAKWKMLADLLDIDTSTTDNIETKCLGDPEKACREVFARWLKGEGSVPSWDDLTDSIDSLGFTLFAQELQEKLP